MAQSSSAPEPVFGWPHANSPFHAGERAAQERIGVAEKMERSGRRMLRDYMPEQHRELFRRLPFLVVGSRDAQGQAWASVVHGAPGFIDSPDATTLSVAARAYPGDPLEQNLSLGAPIGALGIEFESRRRNRVNGVVARRDEQSFALRIEQSFGNCPKYIQRRRPVARTHSGVAPLARKLDSALNQTAFELIARADTFFIASSSPHAGGSDPAEGLDVSHRGGKPGFVRVRQREGKTELAWPDFSGNRMFNTIGNLALEPRAGVLFIDFTSGDALSLAGGAEVAWSGWEIAAFEGAERLITFAVETALWLPGALPLVWSEARLAEELAETGEWFDTDSRVTR